ncbi:MAG TPA: hypothetical protein VIT92_07405 [Burkholderiaceae bacterium]
MRLLATLILAALTAPAFAATPAEAIAQARKGPLARVQSSYLAPGWHEGHVGKSPAGCAHFYLAKKGSAGEQSLALRVAGKLEQQKAGVWTAVALPPLLKAEPASCNDGGDNG